MPSIRLLAENDYDFSSIAAGQSLSIPLLQALDVRQLGCGNVVLRLHAANIPGDARLQLVVRESAPSPDDPAVFFRGRNLAVAQFDASTAVPAVAVAYAQLTTGYVGVFLVATQASVAATFTCRLSADFAPRDKASLWTPADLGAPLTLALDERGQSISAGTLVSWTDQSPVASLFTGFSTPGTGAVNTWPVGSFSGGSFMSTPTTLGQMVSAGAYHGFAVIRATSVTANNPNPGLNHVVIGDTGEYWGLGVRTDGIYAFHWDTAYQQTTAISSPVGTDMLVEWSYDGTTIRCRVGGSATQTTPAGSVGLLTNNIRVAYVSSFAQAFNGLCAAFVVCNQHLADADAQAVRAYLSSKYGVPA
jgi:hypothetical protein